MTERDPVHWFKGDAKYARGWYFCDETWSDRIGPFKTEREARESLDRYVEAL